MTKNIDGSEMTPEQEKMHARIKKKRFLNKGYKGSRCPNCASANTRLMHGWVRGCQDCQEIFGDDTF